MEVHSETATFYMGRKLISTRTVHTSFIYLREIMYLRSLLSAAEHCDFVKFVALKDMLLLSM